MNNKIYRNCYYEFDYDKLIDNSSKFNQLKFDIYKSNFEKDYYDYEASYDFNFIQVNLGKLITNMKENNQVKESNDDSPMIITPPPESGINFRTSKTVIYQVDFGNNRYIEKDKKKITLNAYVENTSDQKSEDRKYLEHFKKEMEYLERIIENQDRNNIVDIHFLKLDEKNFSFNDVKLQKKYKTEIRSQYITKSIENFCEKNQNYKNPKSYEHPIELKLSFGPRFKDMVNKKYKELITENINQDKKLNLLWILFYNLQQYHKEFNLFEEKLIQVQDFGGDLNKLKIVYKLHYSSISNKQEYFKKNEKFITNDRYLVGDKDDKIKYKIVKELLKEPQIFAGIKYINNNESPITMSLKSLVSPSKDEVMYEATIKDSEMKVTDRGKLYKISHSGENENKKTETQLKYLQLKNIITESKLTKDIFFYHKKFLFSVYDLIKFKDSINSKEIIDKIQNKDNFDLYILTNREYFSKFMQYCLGKLKIKLQPDDGKENVIIKKTISILLKQNRPFRLKENTSERNTSEVSKETNIKYVIDKIVMSQFKPDKKSTTTISSVVDIYLKEPFETVLSSKIGKTCEERTDIISKLLNKTKKILFSAYYSAVVGGKTRKKKKRKRRSLNRRKRR
jgi:hypothetical protein